MRIAFVTTNTGKFKEAQHIFGKHGIALEQVKAELPEVRAEDVDAVVEKKVIAAFQIAHGPAIADDTGLFVPSLKGFPGTVSGHFFRALGAEPLLKLAKPGTPAIFRTAVGYFDGNESKICVAEHEGTLVEPEGEDGWGFDPIFLPHGRTKTYAQDIAYKREHSHRAQAFEKLAVWLAEKGVGSASAQPDDS